VRAAGFDALGEEPACDRLARMRFADDAGREGEAGDGGGADRALEVDCCVVGRGAQLAAQGLDFAKSLRAQRGAAPLFGGGEVEAVDERLAGTSVADLRSSITGL